MIPFFILLIVPLAMQHIHVDRIGYQKKNQFALAFFFAILTFLVMARHESVGNDTRNYIRFFTQYTKRDWKQLSDISLEIGYLYYNKVISLFSINPRVFLAVAAITVSALIYPTYKRLCVDASLTILVFCIISTFVMLFSGVRQMLAIGMGFIAYDFTRRRKLLPFILIVLLALTFHTSAFMLIFMYPLYRAKITKKWLYVVIPLLIVVWVFNRPIFSLLSAIIERYTKYEGGVSSTGAYTMLILMGIFTVFAFVIPDESKIDEETIGMRNFLLLALAIQMFAPLHMLAMRMNYYYIIFIPLLLPKIIQCRSKRWNQVAILGRHVMVAFFLVYFFVSAYGSGGLNVFPYHFCWETV